ncbi:hypothetical protein GF385_03595 [Candidatus Dependentiae bacterium]|nr:hypothetical protein [Candidatus Dependentiae bacterium]
MKFRLINKKYFILFLSLFINFFSYGNSVNKSVVNPISEYYKKNKWDFMEKEFVERVNCMKSSYEKYKKLFYLLPLILPSASFCLDIKIDEKIALYFISSFTLFMISLTLYALRYDNIIFRKGRHENLINVIRNFFINYDIDENSKLSVNYREFVPQELLDVFDNIYKTYLEKGEEIFTCSCLTDVFYKLRDKIFYDVKAEKYRKPLVVNNNSPIYPIWLNG